jgi:hypothetical protein
MRADIARAAREQNFHKTFRPFKFYKICFYSFIVTHAHALCQQNLLTKVVLLAYSKLPEIFLSTVDKIREQQYNEKAA